MIQNLINSAIGKVFVASSVEIVRRRLTFYFLLYKASAVPGEVAGMWHAQGPDLNTGLPLGQQWMSRLLALRAVTWAEIFIQVHMAVLSFLQGPRSCIRLKELQFL